MTQRHWLALIVFAACAAFIPALFNEYNFDDIPLVQQHAAPHSLGELLHSVAEPWWPADHRKNLWRPVTRLTISAQQFIQPAALRWPFYAINIALHAAVCVLLYLLALRLKLSARAAGSAALIFAIHPIHSEAVQQIVGRAELLAALAMLCGLYRLATVAEASLSRPRFLLEQAVWMMLAVGAKEHALIYPVMTAFVLLARQNHSARAGLNLRKRAGILFLVLCGVGAVFLSLKSLVTGGILEPAASIPFHENEIAQLNLIQRSPAVLGIVASSFQRMVLPWRLSPDYSYRALPLNQGWHWHASWIGGLLLISCAVFTLRGLRRGTRGSYLALAGLVSYALISNGPFVIGVATAERLWYWPSSALALAFGFAADRLLQRYASHAMIHWTRPLAITACALLIGTTWFYSLAWRSEAGRAAWVLQTFPENWRAHVDRSRLAFNARDFETGRADALEATRILPQNAFGWDWLGQNAMFIPGGANDASAAFAEALKRDPSMTKVHYHWANLLESQGKRPEAAAQLRAYLQSGERDDRDRATQRLAALEKQK